MITDQMALVTEIYDEFREDREYVAAFSSHRFSKIPEKKNSKRKIINNDGTAIHPDKISAYCARVESGFSKLRDLWVSTSPSSCYECRRGPGLWLPVG